MKKIGLGLIAIIAMFAFAGCDNDTKIVTEPGEPLVVTEQIIMECDVPFEFKAVGSFGDTMVGVREGEGAIIVLLSEDGEAVTGQSNVTVYGNEWGVDVGYTIMTPCPEPVDGNETEIVRPTNGICPVGYELSDCNADECLPIKCEDGFVLNDEGVCEAEVEPITCGEGTELDENGTSCIPTPIEPPVECGDGLELNPDTGLCDIIPPLECDIGLVPVKDECRVVVYPKGKEDCLDGYIEGPRSNMCFLESELDRPSPK